MNRSRWRVQGKKNVPSRPEVGPIDIPSALPSTEALVFIRTHKAPDDRNIHYAFEIPLHVCFSSRLPISNPSFFHSSSVICPVISCACLMWAGWSRPKAISLIGLVGMKEPESIFIMFLLIRPELLHRFPSLSNKLHSLRPEGKIS